MKNFWKLILILWALTYSPDHPVEEPRSNSCDSCLGMPEKTTQTCDALLAAKDSSVT